ncbi:MAG: hypothetical protein QW359_00130 [Metallosphaera sp.]
MKAKIIAVVGPVGVGKSTVIKVLMCFFSKSGLKVKFTYIKAFHGPSYLLWKVVRHVLAPKENSRLAPWYVISKINQRIARLLLLISIYLDSITIPLMLMLKVRLPKYRGITVLVEEYLLGTLLDYIYSFYKSEMIGRLHHLPPFRVLMSLCIKYKPDFTILLDANLHEIRRHWDIRDYGDPQIEYVLFQKQFLPKLIQALCKNHVIKFDVASVSVIDMAEIIITKCLARQ